MYSCWKQILFWSSLRFLPVSSFVSLYVWCSSELKPGVNNRAHSIPHSFSKASSSSSCLFFRPIFHQRDFLLFKLLQLRLHFVVIGLNHRGTKLGFSHLLFLVQSSSHKAQFVKNDMMYKYVCWPVLYKISHPARQRDSYNVAKVGSCLINLAKKSWFYKKTFITPLRVLNWCVSGVPQ